MALNPALPARDPGYPRGVAMVLAAGLFLSLTGILVRYTEAAGGWQILFYRSLGFSAAVLAFFALRRGAGRLAGGLRAIGRPGLLVALLLGNGFVLYVFGLLHTTVANLVFTLSAGPFFAALLGWLLLGERVPRSTWLAIAAAVAGVALMVGDGLAGGGLLGIVMALGAVLSFAGMLIVLRRSRDVDMVPATGLAGIVAALVSAAMIDHFAIPPRDLALCLLMGLAVAAGFTLITLGARHVPPAEVALLGLGEAVLAPIWVWLGVGEVPGALTLAGGAVVLAAVVAQALDGIRRERRAAAAAAGSAAALALGLMLAAPAPAAAQQQQQQQQQQQGQAGGSPADSVLGYARWAEKVLAQPPGGIQLLDRLEQRIFELTNQQRKDAGLSPLQQDEALKRPARAHTVALLQGDYFAHEAPGGRRSVADRVAILARDFIGVPAENLFELRGPTPPFAQADIDRIARTVVDGLMTSRGHRENILGREFDSLAVGAAVQGKRVVVTQVFGDRAATLKRPLPLTIEAGTELQLDVTAEDGKAPTRYDFFLPEQQRPATLSLELDSPLAMTEPGRYRLRFYVPSGRDTFQGYNGPDIVIE